MSLSARIELLDSLGRYMRSDDDQWQQVKLHAAQANPWFSTDHVEAAAHGIATQFLDGALLEKWVSGYEQSGSQRTVGIVMAGNIPMVGFHDLLCGFISGHNLSLKLSSKDEVLMKHVVAKMISLGPSLEGTISIADRLTGADAYIATGSNNTARYFEQYFGKYPHIIRKNRTSVAVLDGSETDEELKALGSDIYLYYGLGCRNVTQICVPRGYDFERLLNALKAYNSYADFSKYKNNYDYHLAIYLLNKVPYMSNESLLLVENELPFSAVSVLHYRYYDGKDELMKSLAESEDIQAVVGHGAIPFGEAQRPSLSDYADGVDTMKFLTSL
ncbi:MAG: acyl-CoA reductase [Taibaiella sp.]|nr:acyl-CoA reductase [Taibaiella sp.]